ncbi:GrpE protein 1, mitochondrial [Cichlidogyrus casuarinus]|uniref:GrpE protein homolog n=1 Tax=Cichlidogyrus casuarinus TaxID=1844966 RepID=A0ABD2QBT8_9PLAT
MCSASSDKSSEEGNTISEEKFNELLAENEKLSKQFNETNDKYKRSLAEMENLRKRMHKQVNDAKIFGIQGFCKDLIEVSDILGKASEAFDPNEVKDKSSIVYQLAEGVKMTDDHLIKVFEKHGLLRIKPDIGEKFDPNYHEALFQAPLEEGREPDTIAQVTKVGFKLHERTLRPAFVGVYCK